MKAEYINPFIDAAMNVIQTMASIQVTAGKGRVRKDNKSFGDVSGVIGLAGSGVSGSMVVSFEKRCILHIVNSMLFSQYTDINDEIVDAVGELTNMICGNTKRDLEALGINIQMATPMIIKGHHIELSQLSRSPIITIPFETDAGRFSIDANLVTEEAAQAEQQNREH